MILFVQAQVQFLFFSYLPPFPIPLTVILFTVCTVCCNDFQQGMQKNWGCDSFRFGHQIGQTTKCVGALQLEDGWGYEIVQIMFTCICSRQVELRPGVPWSAAVAVKAYSARSAHLRGEAALSSPVVGLREKRSALAPSEDATNTDIRSKLS